MYIVIHTHAHTHAHERMHELHARTFAHTHINTDTYNTIQYNIFYFSKISDISK